MDLQPAEQDDESLNLRPCLILVRQMFAADENFLVGKRDIDRIVSAALQQGLKGFEDKIVATVHLGVRGRIQSYRPQCCVQPDRKVDKQAGSVRR